MDNRKIRRQMEVCREISMQILQAVHDGNPADRVLARITRARRELGARDRRNLYDLVFALFRWLGWTRLWREDAMDRMLLASLVLDGKGDSLLASTWADEMGLGKDQWDLWSRYSLVEKAARIDALMGPAGYERKPEELFPDWFADAIYLPFDDEQRNCNFLRELMEVFQTRPPVWIRLRDNDRQSTLAELKEKGVQAKPHPSLETTVSIHSPINLNEIAAYREGKIEVQDLSSQAVGLVCSPRPQEIWWDACAGAGGKSLHLAALMQGRGEVWATDLRARALAELDKRARKWRLKNIRVKPQSAYFADKLFDGVLVDAPCSGIGTWRRNPDARWRMAKNDIQRSADVQTGLLNRCAKQVLPGGVLIYSVCTLTAAETAVVLENFIGMNPQFELAPAANPLTGEQTDGKIWIWPRKNDTDGMFIARLKRKIH